MNYKKTIIVLSMLLLVINFFPRWSSPDFRYNGSTPENQVLNLGLPFAHFIIDINNSPFIFFGPTMYFILPLDLLIIFLCVIINRFRNKIN